MKRNPVFTLLVAYALFIETSGMAQSNCRERDFGVFVKIDNVQKKNNNIYSVTWDAWDTSKPLAKAALVFEGEVDIFRCLPGERWIKVGEGKISAKQHDKIGATVFTSAGKDILSEQFSFLSSNLYWRPMVGDYVKPRVKSVVAIPTIVPKFVFAYEHLFGVDEAGGLSYDLSEMGKQLLTDAFERMNLETFRLGIESFINKTGKEKELASESLYRASIVSKFLVEKYKLSHEKIIPIALGNVDFPGNLATSEGTSSRKPAAGIRLRVVPY